MLCEYGSWKYKYQCVSQWKSIQHLGVKMRTSPGRNNPYRWPKKTGFYTRGTLEQTLRQLKEDRTWYVTEKLVGYNLSISTEGWIASKNKIIGRIGMGTLKFQGVSIEKDQLDTLFGSIYRLKDFMKLSNFRNVEFELTLYGKMILKGTGISGVEEWRYRTKNPNRGRGEFICHGIGLVLPGNTHLPFVFPKFISNKECKGGRNFIVPINPYLSDVLKYYGIAHTPTHAIKKLSEILHDDKLVNGIINKKLEGYVLTERHTEVQGLIIQAMKLLGDV